MSPDKEMCTKQGHQNQNHLKITIDERNHENNDCDKILLMYDILEYQFGDFVFNFWRWLSFSHKLHAADKRFVFCFLTREKKKKTPRTCIIHTHSIDSYSAVCIVTHTHDLTLNIPFGSKKQSTVVQHT